MNTSSIKYLGNLRTQATHLRSGDEILTDAPIDNNGKGEAFSPTDLLATSLVSCMITVMGIAARKRNISFSNADCTMQKIMADNPRRVHTVQIEIIIRENWSLKEKEILEKIALNCPVAKSLSQEIKQEVKFTYV
ncbi:MAG: OsmC family protein [Bacteroidota bacterium]